MFKVATYLSEHPENKSAKVNFSVNEYTINEKTVEFIIDSKITQLP